MRYCQESGVRLERRKKARRDEVQTIEGAVNEILSAIRTWTDPCGVVYSLKHKVEKQQKRYLVHVGRFDELDVSMVMRQLVERRLTHSEYTVVKVEFELSRRNIVIHITKSPDPAIRELIDQHAYRQGHSVGQKRRRASEDDNDNTPSQAGLHRHPATHITEGERARVLQMVKNVDDDDTEAVKRVILSIFHNTDASNVEVINRQTAYDLCVSYATTNMVDTRMISDTRESADVVFDARIVYDDSCLVITIPKQASNITN